jgi:hypothetical protein
VLYAGGECSSVGQKSASIFFDVGVGSVGWVIQRVVSILIHYRRLFRTKKSLLCRPSAYIWTAQKEKDPTSEQLFFRITVLYFFPGFPNPSL